MSSKSLDNLISTKKLKSLSQESRFDLAYNAAHALSLAALRFHGYRPDNSRYIVFQVLPHTLKVDHPTWRILDKCHNMRNIAEYEGYLDIDEQLLEELIKSVQTVFDNLSELIRKA